MQKTSDENDIRIFTDGFREDKWSRIELSARLRSENKMLKSFEKGSFDLINNRCNNGSLGTWIKNIFDHMEMKDKFNYIMAKKLDSDHYEEVEYIFNYFEKQILTYDGEPSLSVIRAINNGLNKGDKRFRGLVEFDIGIDSEWTKRIRNTFDNFEEKQLNPLYKDDVPF